MQMRRPAIVGIAVAKEPPQGLATEDVWPCAAPVPSSELPPHFGPQCAVWCVLVVLDQLADG